MKKKTFTAKIYIYQIPTEILILYYMKEAGKKVLW